MSVILRRTIPPNIPKADTRTTDVPGVPGQRDRVGARRDADLIAQIVTGPPYGRHLRDLVAASLQRGESTLVIAPTQVEVEEIAARLATLSNHHVVLAHSGLPASEVTTVWQRAAREPGLCIVGTREVVLWPFAGLGHVVVVEDSRRVMRSPSTPTLGVREVMLERTRRRGIPITFVGPMASLEVLAHRPDVRVAPGRQWPLVEVADRSEEPPTSSPVLERTRTAIAHAVRRDEGVFVLVPHRGHAATVRCVRCGELRRCQACGTVATSDVACARCGRDFGSCASCGSDQWRSVGAGRGNVIEDLARIVGDRVGDRDARKLVTVGTERDLVGVHATSLAVAVDVDGMAFAPNYRAAEDTLRLLIRLAQTLEPGRGRRCLLQTSDPDQPVIAALRAGSPIAFAREELSARRRAGFPPFGALIALEVSGDGASHDLLHDALDGLATVRGPAMLRDRQRWLIHGVDLTRARVALRPLVGTLRDRGAKVRVDVDPYDL